MTTMGRFASAIYCPPFGRTAGIQAELSVPCQGLAFGTWRSESPHVGSAMLLFGGGTSFFAATGAVTTLSGYLVRQYAESVKAEVVNGRCHVRMHFDH